MRILEIGKFYPPVRGGMETVLATLCRGLARRGHELRVLVADRGWPGRQETVDGVDLVRLSSLGSLRSMSLTPGLPHRLKQALREFRPDVAHLHLPHPMAGLAWLMARDETPLVISYHSDIVRQRWLGKVWEPGRNRLLDDARQIVVSSDALAASSRVLSSRRDKCSTVPFGVESAPFEDRDGERARRMRARHGRYFVFVGRLVYYKGLDVLLDAMTDEPFRLVVAGAGPLRASWEATLQRRGLADRIEFLGECDDAELSDWIVGSVGLILPSTLASESFGIVQLEAMAAGRPVIVARASAGVESVQEDGVTALLVPPGDARVLSESMRRLWEDQALADALGSAARARFESHYTAERMVEGVEAVLKKSADVGTDV